MERLKTVILPILLPALTSGILLGQSLDISGTWVGDAVMPGSPEMDKLTLVIEKIDDSYSGKISDSLGLVQDASLKNLTFKNNNLRFEVPIKSNGQDLTLTVGLNFFLERLIGGWGIDTTTFDRLLGERLLSGQRIETWGILDLSRKK